jgi:GNAT superfamily N-acetyltransferase
MSVIVKKVESRCGMRRFIRFPVDLYKGVPYYVPTLAIDEGATLNLRKNPAHKFCKAEFYMAYKDGKPAGRVAAIINEKANEIWEHKEVRYGWIDFIDDPAVSEALLEAVAEFGRRNGMTRIVGPLGFTDEDPEGMVVEGFDQISTYNLKYNFSYYKDHMERLGFEKVIDWLEYRVPIPQETPERIRRIASIVKERYGVSTFHPTRRQILKEGVGRKIFDLINRTYCGLYNFTPLPDDLIDFYVDSYIGLIDSDLLLGVNDKDGKLIGFGISMQSIAGACRKCGGRLFPLGWWHLLKSLRWKQEDTVELMLIAVDPAWMGKGINAIIFDAMVPVYRAHGFRWAETNAELEDNLKIRSIWQEFETEPNKRRRIYGKDL